MRYFLRFPFLILSFFFSFSLFSQTSAPNFKNKNEFLENFKKSLKYNKNEYSIAVLKIAQKSLTPSEKVMETLIPTIWQKMALSFKEHSYTAEETLAIRKKIIDDEILKEEKKIFNMVKERDELIFSNPNFPNINSKEISIRKAMADLESLQKVKDDFKILIPETEKVQVKNINTNTPLLEGNFISYKDLNLLHEALKDAARTYSFDLLIFGRVEVLSKDYFYIEGGAYNSITDKIENYIHFTLERSEIFERLQELSRPIFKSVAGKNFVNFSVKTNSTSAKVYLNGNLVSEGDYHALYQKEGIYNVRVEDDGYKTFDKTLVLNSNMSIYDLEVKLEKTESLKVALNTTPSGANVYLNSVLLGQTPMYFYGGHENDILEFKKEFYFDKILVLKNGQKEFNSTLKPQLFDPKEEFLKSKSEFYTSLGFFAGSLIIPIVFEGLYRNSRNALSPNLEGTVVYDKIVKSINSYFWIRNFGIALNLILFSNLVYKTTRYIKSSQDLFKY